LWVLDLDIDREARILAGLERSAEPAIGMTRFLGDMTVEISITSPSIPTR